MKSFWIVTCIPILLAAWLHDCNSAVTRTTTFATASATSAATASIRRNKIRNQGSSSDSSSSLLSLSPRLLGLKNLVILSGIGQRGRESSKRGRRRRVVLESTQQRQQQQQQRQQQVHNRDDYNYDTVSLVGNVDDKAKRIGGETTTRTEDFLSSRGGSASGRSSNNNNPATPASLWPPWPFNLLFQTSEHDKDGIQSLQSTTTKTTTTTRTTTRLPSMQLFASYLRLKAKGGFEQMQQVGSALSFHLPPAAPPLLLLAILPTQLVVGKVPTVGGAGGVAAADSSTKAFTPTISSFFLNVLAKRLALASLSVAVLSWADYEVRYKKRLTPLPLPLEYRNIRKAMLPPFLPEASTVSDDVEGVVPSSMMSSSSSSLQKSISQPLLEDSINRHVNSNNNTVDSDSNFESLSSSSSFKTTMMKMYQRAASKPQRLQVMMQSWRKMNQIRQREEMEMKRRQIMDELIIWRELKKQRQRMQQGNDNGAKGFSNHHQQQSNPASTSASSPPIGYALVTGASRGIGRALAVELARWEIPLILVARDGEKLCSVANEIEAAYGVNCCVIPADLSNPSVAQQIYRATEDAGLRVDILVNNAGVCTYGDFTDNAQEDIAQMMNVNVGAVTYLSHLYSQNMKRLGRGRILFVSSVIGATPGGPRVATYAATKSYEKSLAQSMGRELEKYGVGVTCIMPGAVKGTDFATNSNCVDSACWKYPFYAMSTPNVAVRGVRALLSGESEVIPGWHNRMFLKVFSPLLPQRLTTSIVGFSFSPLQLGMPSPTFPWRSVESMEKENHLLITETFKKSPPKIIKLEDLETKNNDNSPTHIESPSQSTQNKDPCSFSDVVKDDEHLTSSSSKYPN